MSDVREKFEAWLTRSLDNESAIQTAIRRSHERYSSRPTQWQFEAYQAAYQQGVKESDAKWKAHVDDLAYRAIKFKDENERLADLGLRALCLTRDYVGYGVLPPVDGWEWYEACKVFVAVNPDGEWSQQLGMRLSEALKESD